MIGVKYMKIEHIALYVNDLEITKQYYEKYFKAISNSMYRNEKTGFSSYFLSFKDGARLEIMNSPKLEEKSNNNKRSGFIHLAFSVGSKEKVDEITNRIRVDGYEVISEPRVTGDGYYESCVVDAEGNIIEITV